MLVYSRHHVEVEWGLEGSFLWPALAKAVSYESLSTVSVFFIARSDTDPSLVINAEVCLSFFSTVVELLLQGIQGSGQFLCCQLWSVSDLVSSALYRRYSCLILLEICVSSPISPPPTFFSTNTAYLHNLQCNEEIEVRYILFVENYKYTASTCSCSSRKYQKNVLCTR